MANKKTTKLLTANPIFKWKGLDSHGKSTRGEMSAPNEQAVRAELRRQSIKPYTIKPQRHSVLTQYRDRITSRDLMVLSRQLCTMLRAGISLVQALALYTENIRKIPLRNLLTTIRNDVESGLLFAEALRRHRQYFDPLYCSLVHAGEEAGVLDRVMDKLATHLEKTEWVKARVRKAFTYPIIVMFFAFAVTAILLMFVIPTFEGLFLGFGAELPVLTQWVIALSNLFQNWWWLILPAPFILLFDLRKLRQRSVRMDQWMDKALLATPLVGPVAHTAASARFARTLSTMFEGGVPLVDSLEAVAGATGNNVYAEAVMDIRNSVNMGQQLNFSMRQTHLFDHLVVQMVAIGEEAGSLGHMLSKVADYYEEEVDNRIDVLTTYIEPLLMAFLGMVVGTLVIAMYMPIFKMASAFQ